MKHMIQQLDILHNLSQSVASEECRHTGAAG